MPTPRLPSSLTLPFGYRIKIRQVSEAVMRGLLEEDEEGAGADGAWFVGERAIVILERLARSRKIEVLSHEIDHAVNDWRAWVREAVK